MTTAARTVTKSVCHLDCPDTCSMLVTVEAGVAVDLCGDPEHPFTRGFLCQKMARYLDRVYSSDRLLYPLRRVGPKGAGRFARIGWDEALGVKVALKILNWANVYDRSAALKQMRMEAAALSRVKHPNVVRFIDFGFDPRWPYLVTEFVEGQPLGELLRDGGALPASASDGFSRIQNRGPSVAAKAAPTVRRITVATAWVRRPGASIGLLGPCCRAERARHAAPAAAESRAAGTARIDDHARMVST